jgi:hypothetical protein
MEDRLADVIRRAPAVHPKRDAVGERGLGEQILRGWKRREGTR